jgi:Subunit ChlI of Mg-chelatase
MLYKTLSAAVYGIDASIIEVEVDVSGIKTNEDYFHTVGLPDAAVRENRDRVRAALKNCGYDIPPTHITINLAPADIRKEGLGKNSMNSAVQTFANLFFLAFSILLIAAAFLAPRGRGELGARLKRVALLIAGLIGVVSTILPLTSK